MALTNLKLIFPQPSTTTGKCANIKCQRVKIVGRTFQARVKLIEELPPPMLASRRDAMVCMMASVVTALLSTTPVEARTVKPETRQKIREKLEKLREEAGISKPKMESSSNDEGKTPPSPQNNLIEPLDEATLSN
eukprot:TRINITY_DN21467_c0_g1_i1.p1 TRINITY_DN21467_c0_g1~~TRINITY_DN21467_c0_g1_i1.p1  ORF type:complete len:135 (+),score=27.40 TRINITY_DN21467_c0_g1_i1:65-469(+)